MTRKYAQDNVEVYELWAWYKRMVDHFAEPRIPPGWWQFGKFENGFAIPRAARLLYRERADLQRKLVLLLAPFAPYLAHELWEKLGETGNLLREPWPGEGTFFGLGVNIKFPSDFTKAPYSILASGVATLPQRCEMPFSLINARAESIEGVSPAFNEILPGWVLSDNIYAVLRNERKFAIRNKATRSRLDYEVFRPQIVDLILAARETLRKAEGCLPPERANSYTSGGVSIGPVYIDKDIPGLGKNFMKESARVEGLKAYTFYVRLYALKGLHFSLRGQKSQAD